MVLRAERFEPTTVRRASRFDTARITFAFAAVALACSGDLTGGRAGSIRVASAPAGDTVLAVITQPLVVEVGAPRGTPVVFRANRLPWSNGQTVPSVYFSSTAGGQVLFDADTSTTDADGRASVYLRLGAVATEAIVTALVPSLADSVQIRITVRPGAPVRLVAAPRDTALSTGRSYTLRPSLADRWGNLLPSSGVTFESDSAAVAVQSDGKVSGQAIGRARIVVRGGTYVDTAWTSVVPEGRIAAVYDGSAGRGLVLVNLDGPAWRHFPLQRLDIPRPAWHPNGSYLVASILNPAGSATVERRLAALDTATGLWRLVPGSFGDGDARFSHDGQWIYFASSTAAAISRVRTDGSGVAERVGYNGDVGIGFDHPSPSPDGSRIAMWADVSSGMYTLIVRSSPPLGPAPPEFNLVDSLPTGGQPEWSPVSDDLVMFGSEGMWLMRAGGRTVSDRRYLALPWASITHVTGGFQGA